MRLKSIAIAMALVALAMSAQDKSELSDYDAFLKEALDEYESFRQQINREYADFLSKPWEEVAPKPIVKPKEKDVPPPPAPVIIDENEWNKREDKVIKFDEIIVPLPPAPQPKPIDPIVVEPKVNDQWFDFTFLGNNDKVRLGDKNHFKINGRNEEAVAKAWKRLSDGSFDAALADCLDLRKKYNLCDWAYLVMLDDLGAAYCGLNTDAATLLTAWLYCQSGYKIRLARGADEQLVMLYASDHTVYGIYYTLDNTKFFAYKNDGGSLKISYAKYPKEKEMSLVIKELPKVGEKIKTTQRRKAKWFPEMDQTTDINENIIKFMDTYPSSQIGDNVMTRWALYANTPLSNEARNQIYPKFKQLLAGKTDHEAVSRILNWVQTGFIYEYDDKVWGTDRAFFPDETIYYPYADCEDRAILFSRLVRDLVGLDVILVYYPGHLASAVNFKNDVKGDYIMLNGRKFTVCDPTFTSGAPVGMTGSGMDNSTAKVILLER